ncbi:sigma-B/F/G subfamily RNA polymerase sigma-28 factor [[Clostridium] cellulosi]|uniref:Sigma-B/F/G subfamily RNA polymerase sigma-28 factor n=1 Tax=[Clostridium] cellulosi TaxID=29343 RepID=A0A078KKC7_9FIRM|nr:sigma-B/F/G subfamily RNA polymerase sigma-28 factor [[Clostridium] cellulosi]
MPITESFPKTQKGGTSKEYYELLKRATNGDSAAQTAVIERNLGLVHAAARRFAGRGIEYDDLYQAGCMGLVKAVLGFDLSRGVQFSTYAVPVIMGEMRRLFRDDGPIKVSRTLKEQSLKAVRTREKLSLKLGREPTIGEISSELGMDPAETAQALEACAAPVSLTVDEDGEDIQADIPVESGEDALVDRLMLKDALGHLDVKDRQLIILRYFQNKTQSQTAEILHMTQVQVSRREKKILKALKIKLSE